MTKPWITTTAGNTTWCWVPEGTYLIGEKNKKVKLKGFWIMRTTVTNEMWNEYLADGDETKRVALSEGSEAGLYFDHPVTEILPGPLKDFLGWTQGKLGNQEVPMLAGQEICLELPTEEQWEAAARGPEGLPYPGGDKWDPAYWTANSLWEDKSLERPTTRRVNLHEGTSVSSSPFGCQQMIGNVWEVTSTVKGGFWQVAKGGSFNSSKEVRAWEQETLVPASTYDDVGFRLIANPLN